MPIKVIDRVEQKNDMIMSKIMRAAELTVRECTDKLYFKVFDNLSLPAHTASELRRLDHPFAWRHGSYQPHGHEPIWGVHIHYGIMRKELQKEVEVVGDKYVYGFVGWLKGYSPEVGYVVTGTEKMLPRPVLRLTAEQMEIGSLINATFRKYIKEIN